MVITIASGKGGTGKTTIATNLALSLSCVTQHAAKSKVHLKVQLLDCDVEEPNAHIFIKPDISSKESVNILVPFVNPEKCILCGKCATVCAYHALAVVKHQVVVFPELCHSCGACQYFCPSQAITESNKEIGIMEFGKKAELEFICGRLNIGEVMATPVIKALKKHIDKTKTVIIDAPPGTSCPVIEAVKGSDFCVLVTEPTPFGLNDLILAVEVLQKMQIPFGVVINRCDLGSKDTENYCAKQDIPILMLLPFSQKVAAAYAKGVPLIKEDGSYQKQFCDLFENIQAIVATVKKQR